MCCNKSYQRKFDEKLKGQFFNTDKICNHDSQVYLLLKKVAYPYQYMDDLKRFNETSLPEKEDIFYKKKIIFIGT